MTLSPTQQESLRELAVLWADRTFVLVGASAIACHLEMQWRATADIDVTVAADIAEHPLGLETRPGWSRTGRGEQAWRSPTGARIDVLPVGPNALASGVLRWSSGHEMNVVGYRHVFSSGAQVDIGGGARLRIAELEVLALLKMFSYLDRPDRAHDLADWSHVADAFIPDDDDRRFSDHVFAQGLAYEQVSPFLLGAALGPRLDSGERALVDAFIAAARGVAPPAGTDAMLLQRAPIGWQTDRVGLLGRLDGFERGLRSGSGSR